MLLDTRRRQRRTALPNAELWKLKNEMWPYFLARKRSLLNARPFGSYCVLLRAINTNQQINIPEKNKFVAIYISTNTSEIMKRTEQKIADLEIARDQINARIHVTKARKSDQERRRTTRQKIVLGSGVISLARERDGFKIWLLAALRPKVAARDWPLIEEALSNREV